MAKEKTGTAASNCFVKDTIISGNLNVVSDIRFDGTLNGNLTSAAKVVVGSTAVVNGNIKCINAIVEGKVKGNIEVQSVLDIRKTGHIEGDLICSKMILEDGAYFNSDCKIIP